MATIYGNDADNRIVGTNYSDFLAGGNGDDTLFGRAGHDDNWGQDGHDTIYGGTGNDRMYGETGNDRMYGGTGGDIMNGGAGADTMLGDAGNDIMRGGTGADNLFGGSGANWFAFAKGDATSLVGNGDRIQDGDFTSKGDDTLDLRGMWSGKLKFMDDGTSKGKEGTMEASWSKGYTELKINNDADKAWDEVIKIKSSAEIWFDYSNILF